jgi:hypothetical protein
LPGAHKELERIQDRSSERRDRVAFLFIHGSL